jgi:murein DD-endopeptidase MepM/ murein hydrolase activator NlpD
MGLFRTALVQGPAGWRARPPKLSRLGGLAVLGVLTLWATTALAPTPGFVQAQELAVADTNGSFLWTQASFPVENFQTYTSPFGYRSDPIGGNRRFHYGLDMAAPNGSYIRNWWAGEVVWVEDQGACGTSVGIKSGEWTHIYCHMHGHVTSDGRGRMMVDRNGGVQLRVGQQIPAGARIGRVGMTGRTTGPHLHWGLKYQDNWVDPALVLQAMYVGQQAAR